jgi:hypothetical protein
VEPTTFDYCLVNPLTITRAITSVTTPTTSADGCENWRYDTKEIQRDVLKIFIIDVTFVFPPYSPFFAHVNFSVFPFIDYSCILFEWNVMGQKGRKLLQS